MLNSLNKKKKWQYYDHLHFSTLFYYRKQYKIRKYSYNVQCMCVYPARINNTYNVIIYNHISNEKL